MLFNLTAWKKQKNKQNPQWLLHPIPPPYLPPPFQKLGTGKTKKECGYLPQGLVEPFAVTTIGTAVYMDTLPVAEHNGSAPILCNSCAKKYHSLCKVPITGTMGIEGTQL